MKRYRYLLIHIDLERDLCVLEHTYIASKIHTQDSQMTCFQYVSSVLACVQCVSTAHKPLHIETRSTHKKRDLYRFGKTNWKQYEGVVFSMWEEWAGMRAMRSTAHKPLHIETRSTPCVRDQYCFKHKNWKHYDDIRLVCEQCAGDGAICVCCTYIPTHWEEITHMKRDIYRFPNKIENFMDDMRLVCEQCASMGAMCVCVLNGCVLHIHPYTLRRHPYTLRRDLHIWKETYIYIYIGRSLFI